MESGSPLYPEDMAEADALCRGLGRGALLDKRFAALDPETLHQALRGVLERAPTLLVIAHP